MSSVLLAVLAFLCPLLGAAAGMAMRSRLPKHHLSGESTDVIKLATGLVATLVALVPVAGAGAHQHPVADPSTDRQSGSVGRAALAGADRRGALERGHLRELRLVRSAEHVAAAIFLIVDLGDPFAGFLNLSSAPAHATLNVLGK
jgi:hypothetical protein